MVDTVYPLTFFRLVLAVSSTPTSVNTLSTDTRGEQHYQGGTEGGLLCVVFN